MANNDNSNKRTRIGVDNDKRTANVGFDKKQLTVVINSKKKPKQTIAQWPVTIVMRFKEQLTLIFAQNGDKNQTKVSFDRC